MAIFYLDVDDEITSAAARIRSTDEVDVAIVLPSGSRIATSRINFRLLAREAASHSRRLAIVAPEASARALAASAGLPVFASVMEFEEVRGAGDWDEGGEGGGAGGARGATSAAGEPEDEPGSEPAAGTEATSIAAATAAGAIGAAGAGAAATGAGAGVAGAAGPATIRAGAHTRPMPPAGTPAAGEPAPRGARSGPGTGRPPDRGRPHGGVLGASTGLAGGPATAVAGRRRWPLVLALLLIVAVVGVTGAVAGYVLLPTATISLQLTAEPVAPITFTGTADPDAVSVDAATATIPATRVPIALSATGTFKATGKRVQSAFARGQVRWTNCDPTQSYTIPQGTDVRSPAGVAFRTLEAVFLPVAPPTQTPGTYRCQDRTVDVRAVRDGPAGNVPPGTITVIPGEYNSVVIGVTNLAATSGGVREEFPQVTEKDVAAAVAALTEQLDAQLAGVAPNPPGLPTGAIAYAETARRGEAAPSEPPADIVGRDAETFDLELTADAEVVAADPAPLRAVGLARITAAVPDGMLLREGSAGVQVGPGVVSGTTIRYPVEARAEAVRSISVDDLRALVKGKTAAEATVLVAGYGRATIEIWPSWASTITGIDARLSVSVEGVPPAEPSAEPSPVPTPAPSTPIAPTTIPPTAAPGASDAPASAVPSGSLPAESPASSPTPAP